MRECFIEGVVESKKIMSCEKNIELRTDLVPLFSFKFDVKLMRRVISNLVENAIKYSPGNSTITLSSKDDDKWIRISVTDQGMGIPEEEALGSVRLSLGRGNSQDDMDRAADALIDAWQRLSLADSGEREKGSHEERDI